MPNIWHARLLGDPQHSRRPPVEKQDIPMVKTWLHYRKFTRPRPRTRRSGAQRGRQSRRHARNTSA